MKKILVTGATGFIGNYVISELLKSECEVIATSSNIEKASAAFWFTKVTYIPFNLKEFDNTVNYQEYFNKPDAIIHLAWEGLPNYKAAFHIEENLPRHYAFIKNLVQHGQQNITITGTCLEYGMQEGGLSEDTPANPSVAYAIAKDNLRKQLMTLQQQYVFQLKWVRLFYMYGAGQNPNSLLSQLESALQKGETVFNMSGGEQVRDYLPVQKVAKYIVAIVMQQKITGIINCCSSNPVTVKDFVEQYLINTHKHIQLNLAYYGYADYEPMQFWGDNTKLKSIVTND